MASLASAADVAPFTFKGVASASQQEYWDLLMKYKVFGTNGIYITGQNVSLNDTLGWFGTATGQLNMESGNCGHSIGGPVLIGGHLILSDSRDTLTGPVRVMGNIEYPFGLNWNPSSYNIAGIHCVKGTVHEGYAQLIKSDMAFLGEDYDNCPESVPQVNTSLKIPVGPTEASDVHGLLVIDNETKYIDVPAGEGVFDYYIEGIHFENIATLNIRMPAGGRLTRIFVGNEGLVFGSAHPTIRVVYMGDEALWNASYQAWVSGTSTPVASKDYAGNLLFYSAEDIMWPALEMTDTIQGTYVSAKNIVTGEHMTLAGQLLADTVFIRAFFDSFLFVPFDPPVISPTLMLSPGITFPENEKDVPVPVVLDHAASTDVTFKYCYDVVGEMNTAAGYAAIKDFIGTKKSYFPVCGNSEDLTAVIEAGTTEPTDETKIYINVAKDDEIEGNELLKLKIFDLSGAVLADGSHEGVISLTIADVTPKPSFVQDTGRYYYVAENSPTGKIINIFPVKNATLVDDLYLAVKYQVFGGSATVSSSSVFDEQLVIDGSESYASLFVDEGELLDYEMAPDSFRVTITLKDLDENEYDSVVAVIQITDVNEAPVITGLEDMNKDYAGSPTPFTLYPKENLAAGSIIGAVHASDPDIYNRMRFGALEYSIVDPYGSIPFEMDSNMIVVKDASKLDYEMARNFTFDVEVTNCERSVSTGKPLNGETCLITTQRVTVKIQNVNEAPVIDADKKVETIEIPENSISGSAVFVYDVFDEDTGDASKLTAMYRVLESSIKNGTKFDSLFNIVYNASLQKIIMTVKNGNLLDYEALRQTTSRNDPDPQIKVSIVVQDPYGLADTVVRIIDITDVNEPPLVLDDVFDVSEDAEPGTIVGTIKAIDVDSLSKYVYGSLYYSLLGGDTAMFKISSTGVLTLKEELDYETKNEYKVIVRVDDGVFFVDSEITINVEDVIEWSEVLITEFSDEEFEWFYPDTVYTAYKKGTITWIQDGKIISKDTTLEKGENVIEISYFGLSKNYPGRDTIVIYYEDTSVIDTSEVDTSVVDTAKVDSSKVDTSVVDTIKTEPSKADSLEIVEPEPVEKDTVKPAGPKIETTPVMQDVYVVIASVAEERITLDESPEDGVMLNTVKDKGIQVSYVDNSTDVPVTVSYMINDNGDLKKKTVIDDSGKKNSVEVITVSYETVVDGRNVTVSYQAEAKTGEILVEDASGNLMTLGAAESKPNMGYYTVSYEEVDEDGNVSEISYKMDEHGNVIKNSVRNGNNSSEQDADEYDDENEEVFAEPSFRVVMTGPFQFTIVMEESIALLNAVNSKFAVMDLQGRVIRKGHISAAETVVSMPRTGSYIVRVGLRTRRVNLY